MIASGRWSIGRLLLTLLISLAGWAVVAIACLMVGSTGSIGWPASASVMTARKEVILTASLVGAALAAAGVAYQAILRNPLADPYLLGASSGAVLRIFVMCGAFVGVTGTFIGTVIGIVFCRNIVAIQHAVEDITGGQVFDSSVFQLTALPNTIDWGDVVRVVALGLVLSLLATIYPSWRAARTDPVEALRHE